MVLGVLDPDTKKVRMRPNMFFKNVLGNFSCESWILDFPNQVRHRNVAALVEVNRHTAHGGDDVLKCTHQNILAQILATRFVTPSAPTLRVST